MNISRLAFIVGIVVIVLGAGLWWIFSRSPQPQTNVPPVSITPTTAEAQQTLERAQQLLSLKPAPVQDQIVLFGGTLLNSSDGIITQKLQEQLKVRVVQQSFVTGTTRDAIAAIRPVLQAPPTFLLIDLGRFDAVAGIPLEETIANMRLIVSKAQEVGSTALVVGGIGSDGDVRLSESIRAAVSDDAAFVDASPLLLSNQHRANVTELNPAGLEQLSGQLIEKLSSVNTP